MEQYTLSGFQKHVNTFLTPLHSFTHACSIISDSLSDSEICTPVRDAGTAAVPLRRKP